MKTFKTISVLALLAVCMTAEAKSILGVQVSKSDDGRRVYADIVLENESAVSSVVLDLKYPSSLMFVKSAPEGLGMVYDALTETTSEGWNVYDKNYTTFDFVRVVAMAKEGYEVAPGNNDKLIRLTFNADPSVVYTSADFVFSNASAANGMEREELKFPIGKLNENGYMSYCTSQDVVIEGATAYYGTVAGTTLSLHALAEGEAVFHGQGVVLKGQGNARVFATSVTSAQMPNKNDLKSSLNGDVVYANTSLLLSTKEGVTGFYLNEGTEIEAGRAYLMTNSAVSNVLFNFDDTEMSAPIATDIFDIYHVSGQNMQEFRNALNARGK